MRAFTDTSGIIALLDRSDKHHQDVVKLLQTIEFVVPISVLPEVDYMVTKYLGEQVSRVFLEDISNQKFSYLTLDNMDIKQTAKFMKMYADIPIGFVDASLAALADRHQIQNILTLDRRHFNLIRSQLFTHFNLLP